jgi:hypothetical protein
MPEQLGSALVKATDEHDKGTKWQLPIVTDILQHFFNHLDVRQNFAKTAPARVAR